MADFLKWGYHQLFDIFDQNNVKFRDRVCKVSWILPLGNAKTVSVQSFLPITH